MLLLPNGTMTRRMIGHDLPGLVAHLSLFVGHWSGLVSTADGVGVHILQHRIYDHIPVLRLHAWAAAIIRGETLRSAAWARSLHTGLHAWLHCHRRITQARLPGLSQSPRRT